VAKARSVRAVTYLLTTPRMRAWHDRGLQEGLTMSALDTAVRPVSRPLILSMETLA
jgi:hypothetical protein